MASFSCCFSSPVSVSVRMDRPSLPPKASRKTGISQRCAVAFQGLNTELFGCQVVGKEMNQRTAGWSFLGGSRTLSRPSSQRQTLCGKTSAVYASWVTSSHLASNAFTLGTAAVLPFYTFMVVAPRSELTKKLVESSVPYVVLGLLYAYLLYLSWTPDTIRLMFASKYWLPELSGIAKMFSSEMTLASAWIHLLAIDLFAARQVYHEGLEDNIETRHSVSLCLLFCPIGILAHFITKSVTGSRGNRT